MQPLQHQHVYWNVSFATPVDLNAVRDYLINYHLDSVSERSLADKAIEVIVQFVAQNRGKFSDDTRLSTLIENYGMISLEDDHIQVKMIASVFKNMLKEHNFQDTNNVIDALRDKDYIQSDANRKTTKRSVKDKEGKPKPSYFIILSLINHTLLFLVYLKKVNSIYPYHLSLNTNIQYYET